MDNETKEINPTAVRVGGLELRAVDRQLMTRGPLETLEIVKWFDRVEGDEFCFTLCYWLQSREGFDLRFVGNRPLVHADADQIWPLITHGQALLDMYFEDE